MRVRLLRRASPHSVPQCTVTSLASAPHLWKARTMKNSRECSRQRMQRVEAQALAPHCYKQQGRGCSS